VRLKCARPAAFNPPDGFWYFLTTPMCSPLCIIHKKSPHIADFNVSHQQMDRLYRLLLIDQQA
jgi:hypothetical protein